MKKVIFFILIACSVCGCRVQKTIGSAQFTQDIRQDLPFKVTELTPVNEYTYSFRCDGYEPLQPDYEVDTDGACMVYRTTFMSTHAQQSPSFIWRNIVINHKAHRVLCIDRLLKDGKTFGYVYFMQSETKEYTNGFHWDVTDQRLMLNVAGAIEGMSELSTTLLQALTSIENK